MKFVTTASTSKLATFNVPWFGLLRALMHTALLVMVAACGGSGGDGGGGGVSVSGGGTSLPPQPMAVFKFAGNRGGAGNQNGIGSDALFNQPIGIATATDSAGNVHVYVADAANHTIRRITTDKNGNTTVITVAGKPRDTGVCATADGTGGENGTARFCFPKGIAIDKTGILYVADTGNHTIRTITPDEAGGFQVETLAGVAGWADENDGVVGQPSDPNDLNSVPHFFEPTGIATYTDAAGKVIVYVTDSRAHTIRKITRETNGVHVDRLAGAAFTPGSGSDSDNGSGGLDGSARFNFPQGIAVDKAGVVYVADTGNTPAIRKITQAEEGGVPVITVDTLASTGFNVPRGIATDTDSAGQVTVYAADAGNHTILTINSTGQVSTLAGKAGVANSTNGTGTDARFNAPQGIATYTDSQGKLTVYVADTNNNMIRSIDSGRMVRTVAGSMPTQGATDGTGLDARFKVPSGIVTDSKGNVYVADTENHTIRKITAAGVVSILAGDAGTPGFDDRLDISPNSPPARFRYPRDLAIDSADNVYVADTGNHTIRMITATGVVSTLAGEAGTSGDNERLSSDSTAHFYSPQGLVIDSAGNIYVADTDNSMIRKISQERERWFKVTNLPSLNFKPLGLAIDSLGNIYVPDYLSNSILKIAPNATTSTVLSSNDLGLGTITLDTRMTISGSTLYLTTDFGVLKVINLQ